MCGSVLWHRQLDQMISRVNTHHKFITHTGAVDEQSTDPFRAAGTIPAQNMYLYCLQVVVPGLSVRVFEFTCL